MLPDSADFVLRVDNLGNAPIVDSIIQPLSVILAGTGCFEKQYTNYSTTFVQLVRIRIIGQAMTTCKMSISCALCRGLVLLLAVMTALCSLLRGRYVN